MVVGIVLSSLFDLENQFSINIVGDIPLGFSFPKVPYIQLIPSVLVDSVFIAVVSFLC